MSNQLLVGVKFNWRGEYDATATYAKNDAVSYKGQSYAAIDTALGVPPTAPAGSPDMTRFNFSTSGTTFRCTEVRPSVTKAKVFGEVGYSVANWPNIGSVNYTSATSAIVSSTVNPTLRLVRGYTYTFDYSAVSAAQPFALRVSATDTVRGISGARGNDVQYGNSAATYAYLDANNRQRIYTEANKIVTFTVPGVDTAPWSSMVYVNPLSTSQFGVIQLLLPQNEELMSASWVQIAVPADQAASTLFGIPAATTGGVASTVNSTFNNDYLLTSGGSGAATITVTNSGSSAYVVNGYNNSALNLIRGTVYTIQVNASGHPFWIQTSPGAYNAANVVAAGITNNGASSGTIIYDVPANAPSTLYYVCQNHAVMGGTIYISGTTKDLHWSAPKGRLNNKLIPYAPRAWDPYKYEATQSSIMPRSRQGILQGQTLGTWIMPDRRSLKSAGFNRQGGLGYNAMSNQFDPTTYPGNRYNNIPEYCQFDEAGLAKNDEINFVTGNLSMQALCTKRGRVYFVGYNGYGQFGLGDTNNRYVFTRNSFFGDTEGRTAVEVQVTYDGEASNGNLNAVFVQTLEGELYAAGYNAYGQLGDGTTTNRTTFVRIGETSINRLGKTMTSFQNSGCSDYYSDTIAWNNSNEIYGWGNNNSGNLGFGDTSNRTQPTRMTNLESVVTPNSYPLTVCMLRSSITSASIRLVTAILFSDNHIYTCGKSNHGQLGTNVAQSTDAYTYGQVTRPAGKLWAKLTGSGGASGSFYALTTDGLLYAWGYNGYGQLGDGTTTNRTVPTLCSALPDGFQGFITHMWVLGGDSYSTVWVKTSTNKYCTFGWYGSGTTMQNRIVSADWNTTVTPREITPYLPYHGVGIVAITKRFEHANQMTLSLEYSNGEMFYVGYNNFEGYNPSSGDGTGYGQGTGFFIQYPKLANNFIF